MASIFLDIDLPNATTWFYFSGLLTIALFFKFGRLFSIRNWDLLTMFLLMPGLLLLLEKNGNEGWGYLWAFTASGYFLVRCLFDLILVRRPALSPNLNLAGLVWLAGALFVSQVAVAALPHQGERPASGGDTGEKAQPGPQMTVKAPAAPPLLTNPVECSIALVCHLSIVVGLVLIGYLHFDDVHAGMAAATFYLLLPYTYLMTPGGGLGRWDHAWPMAWMIWAVLLYRRPMLAGLFIGVAAGTVFFPVLLLPVWLSFYWRRGMGRFALAYALAVAMCLAGLALVVWINGTLPHSLQPTWTLENWQPWAVPKGVTGFWNGIHWVYRMPVFVLGVTFVVATLVWPMPKNLAHVIALSAAILISMQFWYADQGGIYVLWYLPFLLLLVFRPNLSACQPTLAPDDWPARLGRFLLRGLVRFLLPRRPPGPPPGRAQPAGPEPMTRLS
jgi:hypothetical protein